MKRIRFKPILLILLIIFVAFLTFLFFSESRTPQYLSFDQSETYYLEQTDNSLTLREASTGTVMFVSSLPENTDFQQLVGKPLAVRGVVVSDKQRICSGSTNCPEVEMLTVEILDIKIR